MRHGGDLSEARDRYGEPSGGWIDLSTGVNPRPYPVAPGSFAGRLSRFPTQAEIGTLVAAARRYYQASDFIGVTPCPGTEIVIRSLPFLTEGGAILVKTSYGSYEAAWTGAARDFEIADDLDAAERRPSASVVVVNPNNPDGRLYQPPEILELARARTGSALVIVDEAYSDAEPGSSVVPHLRRNDRVLALRSFGKFFGLPGLRLGFAVGPQPLIHRIASFLGDWPVSTPAAAIGAEALADSEWQSTARHWLANQSLQTEAVLRRAGLQVVGGTRLFRLVSSQAAGMTHERLARAGIWTRTFDAAPDLLRIGMPAGPAELERLAAALPKS